MSKEQLIVDLWQELGREAVGASELEQIERRLLANGVSESPAAIARTLADHGARLVHPDILDADVTSRLRSALFIPEDFNFETAAAAARWMERVDGRYHQQANNQSSLKQLRHIVLGIKRELELIAASDRAENRNRQLAHEVAQWLTVWLQNPAIFSDWFALRRNTADYRRRFE